jgi:hypothetical protein
VRSAWHLNNDDTGYNISCITRRVLQRSVQQCGVIIWLIPFVLVRHERVIHTSLAPSILNLFPTSSLILPSIQTPHIMLLFLTLSVTISVASSACAPPMPNARYTLDSPPPKREAQEDPLIDIDLSWTPIDLPKEFLPPPWNPFSNLDSPYPSDAAPELDDNGHSQMVDNEPPTWRACPKLDLDCRKCPRDFRCRRPQFPDLAAGGESEAPLTIAGADIPPEDDGQGNCPLQKCDDNVSRCGTNARCTRGFCVCDLGLKGAFRGNDGLGAVTVYNNPGAGCEDKCDDLSCKEVEQLEVDVCFRDGYESNSHAEGGYGGYDGLETDDVG